jgi:hypothetical protein
MRASKSRARGGDLGSGGCEFNNKHPNNTRKRRSTQRAQAVAVYDGKDLHAMPDGDGRWRVVVRGREVGIVGSLEAARRFVDKIFVPRRR